jgi:hypothetical protein
MNKAKKLIEKHYFDIVPKRANKMAERMATILAIESALSEADAKTKNQIKLLTQNWECYEQNKHTKIQGLSCPI